MAEPERFALPLERRAVGESLENGRLGATTTASPSETQREIPLPRHQRATLLTRLTTCQDHHPIRPTSKLPNYISS
eukprot:6505892-Prymnesium_polylepis.1